MATQAAQIWAQIDWTPHTYGIERGCRIQRARTLGFPAEQPGRTLGEPDEQPAQSRRTGRRCDEEVKGQREAN